MPSTIVGVASREVSYTTVLVAYLKGRRLPLTVTTIVWGIPTVSVMLRCTASWFPDTIMRHTPDLIAENGIPLLDG